MNGAGQQVGQPLSFRACSWEIARAVLNLIGNVQGQLIRPEYEPDGPDGLHNVTQHWINSPEGFHLLVSRGLARKRGLVADDCEGYDFTVEVMLRNGHVCRVELMLSECDIRLGVDAFAARIATPAAEALAVEIQRNMA
jgi:hypothetical protein